MDSGSGFEVETETLHHAANLLLEISGWLHAGRMDHDYGTRARAPFAHRELGADVDRFARFVDDQYGDLTLLLFALSSKLKATGADYRNTDFAVQLQLGEILAHGQYVKPEDR